MAEKKSDAAATGADQAGQRILWNTANLKSSYANVCNVTSTREEVVLNFGINQSWERGQHEMEIQLTDRIILSPFAAKRLSMMLTRLMGEYETRYGELKLEAQNQVPPTQTKQ
jgi:hypothetical protein